jgi:type I restriction enzyme M protein
MPDYLQDIAEAEAKIAELEQQKSAFEQGEEAEADAEEGEELETVNIVKDLEIKLKYIRNLIKEPKKELKILKKASLFNKDKIAELEVFIERHEVEIAEIEAQLEPYKETVKQLRDAKAKLKTLKNELVKRLSAARAALTDEDCRDLVLAIFKDGLIAELERYVTAHRQMVIAAVENWWDKYRVTLQDIETERDAAAKKLSEFLQGLGYV